MISCRMLNGACRLLYSGEYRRFRSVNNIGQAQQDYLFRLLGKNADTVYGRRYGFSGISSYKEFAARVPLTRYEDYEKYIHDIADGAGNVLTAEKVLLFEPTSGSSGGKKLIPYTAALKAEFQRGIKPWLYDIYKNVGGASSGKSYWSITPVTAGRSTTKAGIPIGFEEDSAYFGRFGQALVNRIFAVDGSVKFPESMDAFWLETARQLLKCKSLTLISVWNPTFLTILCGHIRDSFTKLKNELPVSRAEEIYRGLSENRFDMVFPDLKIISCWADGSAFKDAEELKKLFPTVYLQPKGLLATEYFASFPLVGEEGGRLSVNSHFFEFRRPDGKIITAEGLERGEYELIVTTGGGFYRYMTGDVIEVFETYPAEPPRIGFLRRSGVTSDLRGEKLTDDFVRSVCERLGIAKVFCLLAPEDNGYTLYTSSPSVTCEALDRALRESYHYNYCRELGQLSQARVVRVAENSHEIYLKRLVGDGMRLGDIKPAYLSSKSGWRQCFETGETK
ncbi:GH3 family domain-containing protein [Ruminococcus sp.]|uniref:GH3 family domain-containing protein n=1 Tax=Ruminococcus sp. TaxID=41978 RepID=UPI002E764986|nr:GH3 auxin-responsive promoter family protein [Ruminococcus sp.]MEE1263062.1 GH3 auxin-responsive promoter family protein [Ruminococcus sp.]